MLRISGIFDADPGSGMEKIRIRDGKKSDPGTGINIPEPQHCLLLLFFLGESSNLPNGLMVICVQVIPVTDYYIVAGVVYQAPDLGTLLNSR